MPLLPDWRRVNNWFIVVTADTAPLVPLEAAAQDDPDGHPLDLRYRASLVDRFPLEDSQESRIENGISDFCFPDGLKLSRAMVMPKFFCFVLTDGEGNRTYGSCLTIFELLPEDAEAALREQIAAWGQRQAARRRQKDEGAPPLLREEGKTAAFFAEGSVGDDCASSSGGSDSEERDGEAEGAEGAEALAAAAEGIYLPRCLCVLSKYPFVATTCAWLMQLYRLSLTPTPVPLERYISNFLLEVPAPVPGRMGVQLQMLDQSLDYPCPPPHEPLAWSGLQFEPVLEMVAPEALVGAFACVLTEQQLLLHSSSLSLLTATAEFLTACLYPLAYCHVYIPVLPRHCLYIPLNSPVPFILGTSSAAFRTIASQLPDTVTVLDLDNSKLIPASGVAVPPLPERRRTKLLKALRDHAPLFVGGVDEKEEGGAELRRSRKREGQAASPTTSGGPTGDAATAAAATTVVASTSPSPSPSPSRFAAATAAAVTPSTPAQPGAVSSPPSASAGEAPTTPAAAPAAVPSPKEVAAREQRAEARRRRRARLRALDDPFTSAWRHVEAEASPSRQYHRQQQRRGAGKGRANWDGVKDAALGCMVSLLRDYRRYLVLPTKEDPKPKRAFRAADFLASQPAEWGPFLEELVKTQAFQSFIDAARLAPGPAGDPESAEPLGDDAGAVVYFDEVLAEARQHRSRFSLAGTRVQPSFRRPAAKRDGSGGGGGGMGSEGGEVKTVVALQPDVQGLPGEPFVYTGFPNLMEKWYAAPRPVSEEVASLGGEEYDRRSNRGRGKGRKGARRRNAILRFKSDHVPSDPATLVFSVFETAFAQTIGRDLHEPARSNSTTTATTTTRAATTAAGGGGGAIGPLDAPAVSEEAGEPEPSEPPGALAKGLSELSLAYVPNPSSSSGGPQSQSQSQSQQQSPEKETNVQGLAARQSPPLALRRSSSVVRLRPKMRRLSEDLKEEKVHVANGKLSVAFDVLQRMRAQRVPADEWTYRSLIDAAGRLGNVDLALRAVTEMNEAGFPVDASVLSCLVAAFAMNDKTSGAAASQASQALALLEWSNKVRRGGSGGAGGGGIGGLGVASATNAAAGGLGGPGGSGGSGQRLSLRMSMGGLGSGGPASGTRTPTKWVFKDLLRKMGSGGSGGGSGGGGLSTLPGTSSSAAPGLGASGPARGGSNGSEGAGGGAGAGSGEVSRSSSAEVDMTAPTASGLPVSVSLERQLDSSSTNPSFDLELDESALRDAEEREGASRRPRSVRPSNAGVHLNTPLVKCQVLLSESLLGLLFPGLALDVDSETCPECNAKLTAAQVAAGFRPDANDYTTVCPLCTAARELRVKQLQHQHHQLQAAQPGGGVVAGLQALDIGLFPVEKDKRPASVKLPPPPPPVRRFVARFSVKCAAQDWVGSMGPGTPLWCEYLSPWVLRKEIQNIIVNDGIEALTAPEFRTASPASATIFWNLILWLHYSYALPVQFLLQESVDRLQAQTAAVVAAAPSH